MKKLFSVLLVALFVVCFALPVMAADGPALKNVTILGANGGADGVSAMTEIVKVRYARGMGAKEQFYGGLSSGDVVVWDTISADGVTISASIADVPTNGFAGVLVTDIETADNATLNSNNKNWGYMAVRGYCLAQVDTSESTTGVELCQNGATLEASFGTCDLAGGSPGALSQDIGTLLTDTGSDGLMKVWLR